MASKLFNRPPLQLPVLKDKSAFFNHADWKGFTDNKNFVTNDQQMFRDCKNVYVDTNDVLSSRPAIKSYDLLHLDKVVLNKPSITIEAGWNDNDIYETFIMNGTDGFGDKYTDFRLLPSRRPVKDVKVRIKIPAAVPGSVVPGLLTVNATSNKTYGPNDEYTTATFNWNNRQVPSGDPLSSTGIIAGVIRNNGIQMFTLPTREMTPPQSILVIDTAQPTVTTFMRIMGEWTLNQIQWEIEGGMQELQKPTTATITFEKPVTSNLILSLPDLPNIATILVGQNNVVIDLPTGYDTSKLNENTIVTTPNKDTSYFYSTQLPEISENINDIWEFNEITVIRYNNTLLKFINNSNGSFLEDCRTTIRMKPIRVKNKIFIFGENMFSVYIINNSSGKYLEGEEANNFIYAPIKDSIDDKNSEDDNILTTSVTKRYDATSENYNELIGKTVTVKMLGGEQTINPWVEGTENVLVEQIGSLSEGFVIDKTIGNSNNKTVAVRYKDVHYAEAIESKLDAGKQTRKVRAGKAVDLRDSIAISTEDGPYIVVPVLPNNGPTLVNDPSHANGVAYLPAARYGNPWLSDDGLWLFAITNYAVYKRPTANHTIPWILEYNLYEKDSVDALPIYVGTERVDRGGGRVTGWRDITTEIKRVFSDGIVPTGAARDGDNWFITYEQIHKPLPPNNAGWFDITVQDDPPATYYSGDKTRVFATIFGKWKEELNGTKFASYTLREANLKEVRQFDPFYNSYANNTIMLKMYINGNVSAFHYYTTTLSMSWLKCKNFNSAISGFANRNKSILVLGNIVDSTHAAWTQSGYSEAVVKMIISDYPVHTQSIRLEIFEGKYWQIWPALWTSAQGTPMTVSANTFLSTSGSSLYYLSGDANNYFNLNIPNTNIGFNLIAPLIAQAGRLNWKLQLAISTNKGDSLITFQLSFDTSGAVQVTNIDGVLAEGNLSLIPLSNYFVISPNGEYVLSDTYMFYNNVLLNLLTKTLGTNTKPIFIKDNGILEYINSNKIFLSSNQFELLVRSDGFINYLLPEYNEQLDEIYFTVDNTLYITSTRTTDNGDFLWYVPKRNIELFNSKITNLHILSKDEMAIFLANEMYVGTVVEGLIKDATSSIGYTYSKSKLQQGCRDGDNVITSLEGTNIIFPTARGIALMTYQQFMATTEQALSFASDIIQKTYSEMWDSKNPIKMTIYKYWILFTQINTNKILVLDLRKGSWWKWEYNKVIRKTLNIQEEVIFLCEDNKTYKLIDEGEYKDDEDSIEWSITSQRLHFNVINNYKKIHNFVLNLMGDTQQSAKLIAKVFKDNVRSIPDMVMEYEMNTIKTLIQRVHIIQLLELEYTLKSDEKNEQQSPLKMSALSIRYEVKERAR